MTALGTARGSFLRNWRLLAIDGFEVDVPDSTENAAEFGYAGSGDNRSAFPKARVVAIAECGTHAFVAAEIGACGTGEKTLAQRLYPRLCPDELLTADRGFYSWQAWDTAQATGAALLWRAPTQLGLPVVRVLPDGTYLTVLIKPAIRGRQRERLLAAARAGEDLDDMAPSRTRSTSKACQSCTSHELPSTACPTGTESGTGELIVLLSTILGPDGDHGARPASWPPATTSGGRKKPETDQLKTHLRGPGRVLRSRLPDLVYRKSGPI